MRVVSDCSWSVAAFGVAAVAAVAEGGAGTSCAVLEAAIGVDAVSSGTLGAEEAAAGMDSWVDIKLEGSTVLDFGQDSGFGVFTVCGVCGVFQQQAAPSFAHGQSAVRWT